MIIRRLDSPQIFLTFDDGPHAQATPRVLDLLARKGVPATFFLVANRLRSHLELVARMQREGHAIGNHSWDHGYANFFRSRAALRGWVARAEAEFASVGVPLVSGFRPPAGVLTPPLLSLGLPLILWNIRFFDTLVPLWRWRARWAGRRAQPGSIILLHDLQTSLHLRSLEVLIDEVHARGLGFGVLKHDETNKV